MPTSFRPHQPVPSDLVALQESVENCLNIATRLLAMASIQNLTPGLAVELVSSLKMQVAETKSKFLAVSPFFQREGPPVGIVQRSLQLSRHNVITYDKGPLRGVTYQSADMTQVQSTIPMDLIMGHNDEEILGETGLAIEAAIEWTKRVFEGCCFIADPLNNIPTDGGFRKLDPESIRENYDSVFRHLRSMALPDLRRVRLGISDEIAGAASRTNQRSGKKPDPPSILQRVSFDDSCFTITVDQVQYEIDNPVPYNVFKGLFHLHVKNMKVVTDRELRRLQGLSGKAIGREIRKLPKELQDLMGSKTGSGRWITLPPL